MVNLTNEERLFAKQAIDQTANYFPEDFDATTQENLITIVNKFRALGLMTARYINPEDYNLWTSIRNKLGSPVKTAIELVNEDLEKTIEDTMVQISKEYDAKIERLEKQLRAVVVARAKAEAAEEGKMQAHLDKIAREKAEAEQRLEAARTSRERLEVLRKKEQLKKEAQEEAEIMMVGGKAKGKCWKCGEWYYVRGGSFTKHKRKCKVIPVVETEEEIKAEE